MKRLFSFVKTIVVLFVIFLLIGSCAEGNGETSGGTIIVENHSRYECTALFYKDFETASHLLEVITIPAYEKGQKHFSEDGSYIVRISNGPGYSMAEEISLSHGRRTQTIKYRNPFLY